MTRCMQVWLPPPPTLSPASPVLTMRTCRRRDSSRVSSLSSRRVPRGRQVERALVRLVVGLAWETHEHRRTPLRRALAELEALAKMVGVDADASSDEDF